MAASAELELFIVLASLILTVVFAFLVYGISKELSLGIFQKFFKILIAAALVSIVGRGIALMQIGGRLGPLGAGIELASGLLFFVLLTFAFWVLLRDWRKISLEKPVKRGGASAS